MMLEVSEKEAQLVQYFRNISRFNRERVFSMARNAADDFRRAEKIRDYLSTAERK